MRGIACLAALALGLAPGIGASAEQPAFGVEPFIHHRDPPFFRALDDAERARAELGHEVLNTHWVPAGTPNAQRRDGVGPLFNVDSCDECHNEAAHGRGPMGDGLAPFALEVHLEEPPDPRAETRCDPVYGCVFNPVALKGVRPEGQVLIHYREVAGRYPDGSRFSLRVPSYRLVDLACGPLAPQTIIKPRIAPAIFGDGLLEAVPASAIVKDSVAFEGSAALEGSVALKGAAAAAAKGSSGAGASRDVRGVPAWQWRHGAPVLGRFGWQGSAVSIRDQTARAFAREMGLTSSVIARDDCTAAQVACLEQPNGGSPEVSDTLLDAVVDFESWLAVPASPQAPAERGADESVLFAELGCAACHQPRLPVELRAASGERIRRTIEPYTDLRLHDLGMALADENAAGVKVPSRWRTAPLWGLGYRLKRESSPTFLHDGRARSVAEAILWHGGEALGARRRFERLRASQRQALLLWLATL